MGSRKARAAADFAPAGAAVLFFVPLFIFKGFGPLDFWQGMAGSLVLLVVLGAALDRDFASLLWADVRNESGRKILRGVVSAVFLYAVFWAGNAVSRVLFSFAEGGISEVYGFKDGASTFRIGFLLGLIIGPGEELFWRGFLQRRWAAWFGPGRGFLAATVLYAAVHAGSGNPMLISAAAICGVFWGFLYLRTGSALLCAVSHTLWDLAVFLVFPFA
ncbi:MAG: CAAX amino terminal protease self- immunity [Candidatus Aminicenantes bacterium ADurb.Bin147]|nr:MAG: CAAX amino terminal protease self- immunity [Candidatus Aminicenantes bacterium ADurb.Bin147]